MDEGKVGGAKGVGDSSTAMRPVFSFTATPGSLVKNRKCVNIHKYTVTVDYSLSKRTPGFCFKISGNCMRFCLEKCPHLQVNIFSPIFRSIFDTIYSAQRVHGFPLFSVSVEFFT